jgi:hypothetical protein
VTTITLEDIQAEHNRLAVLIAALTEQSKPTSRPTLLIVPEATITLQVGEHYAGTVLDADGKIKHHLVLMAPRPDSDLDWDDAMAWAEEIGGSLPDRQEQALLYANCKPHLKPVWQWSCQQHEQDASFAWDCTFINGSQEYDRKSAEGAAVAIRRVTP